jgi:hypothetical protein
MKSTEQEAFVREVIDGFRDKINELLPKIPPEWDGHELRQWLSEVLREEYVTLKLDGKRLKAYRADRLVRNI